MKKNILATCGLLFCTSLLHAQTTEEVRIDFENQNYKALGVYDTWLKSPFRSQNKQAAALEGNVQVVSNIDKNYDEILKATPNASNNVLGFQRSRFGSNTFGARIDLKQPFALTKETKYVHVMIHKPKAGRTMLIGLGKRTDRKGQSADTEQFWELSTREVEPNKWVDAVFPVKGAGGIEIHSLVVVVDCEDTNGLKDDFLAYIDNIVVNNEAFTTTNREDYPMNYNKDAKCSRSDRGLKGISLGDQTFNVYGDITTSTPAYTYLSKQAFLAKPGETLNPAVQYKGVWMHSYVYLDLNNNGRFEPKVEGGQIVPNAGNELLAYSFLGGEDENSGFNSAGTEISGNGRNTLVMPEFTLPSDLQHGFYRMRYKVDWNSADAGGSIENNNHILNNGGGAIDVRLNVHGDNVKIYQGALNGKVVAEDGTELNGISIPFGKPYTIKMKPEHGFNFSGLKVRHGYNLTGDSISHGTYQYVDELIPRERFNADGTFTLPAEMIDGDISLEGIFIDAKTALTYEVYFNNEFVYSTVVNGAKTGAVTIPEGLARDYVELTADKQTITSLPATVRINATWTAPMKVATPADTTWYNLKVSNQPRWVSSGNYTPNVYFIDETYITTDYALWALTGNPYSGFRLINKAMGPTMVLASASPKGSAKAGGNTYATLLPADNLPAGYTSEWTVTISPNDDEGFYICNPEGFGLNYRADGNLAYWTGGKDGGSTFVPTEVKKTSTGIHALIFQNESATTYDLSGKTVSKSHKGVVIRNGKKMLVK
nr:GEVED domain-containing protein [uncultured Prevotella sp.]